MGGVVEVGIVPFVGWGENMREIEALTNDIDIKIKEAIDREILFG